MLSNRRIRLYSLLRAASGEPERKRRRRSRWGAEESDKTFIPGMPTVLPTNLSKEQEEAYVCKYLKFAIASYVNVNNNLEYIFSLYNLYITH